ncbi:hypothetical protein C7M84_003063 [Penaeus vannamei]|uniref:Uncharacterized protein n=1 Tax=Penaeus vannamei TaxID=6689 RepID=A0A3R7N623_PENVA|nr:hypothetical protein C7M84_003063 [Penaeus vannamei]
MHTTPPLNPSYKPSSKSGLSENPPSPSSLASIKRLTPSRTFILYLLNPHPFPISSPSSSLPHNTHISPNSHSPPFTHVSHTPPCYSGKRPDTGKDRRDPIALQRMASHGCVTPQAVPYNHSRSLLNLSVTLPKACSYPSCPRAPTQNASRHRPPLTPCPCASEANSPNAPARPEEGLQGRFQSVCSKDGLQDATSRAQTSFPPRPPHRVPVALPSPTPPSLTPSSSSPNPHHPQAHRPTKPIAARNGLQEVPSPTVLPTPVPLNPSSTLPNNDSSPPPTPSHPHPQPFPPGHHHPSHPRLHAPTALLMRLPILILPSLPHPSPSIPPSLTLLPPNPIPIHTPPPDDGPGKGTDEPNCCCRRWPAGCLTTFPLRRGERPVSAGRINCKHRNAWLLCLLSCPFLRTSGKERGSSPPPSLAGERSPTLCWPLMPSQE